MSMMTNHSDNTDGILLVEDSTTQAEELKNVLAKRGYIVTLAMDGRQALACLNGYHPGLIISDIFMPVMNGYELCQHIKANESTRDIPVILLTAFSEKLDLVEVLACGADSFITKSYDEDYLLLYVEKTMANKSLQQNNNPGIELEIALTGTSRMITAEPHKMISLLLSTYDAAMRRTSELIRTQEELRSLNDHLEDLVKQRTAALSEEIAERERLQDELRALSLQDELTGLHNRRGFMVMAEQLWRLAKRNRQNLVLLYMDFDNLKYINDAYGHAKGDQALRDVARDMEIIFRESDILARVGGDEFTVLITDCDLECARITINRLNEKLNHTNTTSSQFYILSLSIGLAHFDQGNPTSIKDLMEQADADMYLQKQQKKRAL